jgi:hypothetical protein
MLMKLMGKRTVLEDMHDMELASFGQGYLSIASLDDPQKFCM